MSKNAAATDTVKIMVTDRITREIVISTSLHFIIVFLLIFFPPFFMHIKEPTITEVTLINNLEPIPMPSIKEEMRSPSPVPAPVIQKTAPPAPKAKSIPKPEKAIVDEPVKDIGRIGIPARTDIGKKETASFSKKGLDSDIPLPKKPIMQEARNIPAAMPTIKKGAAEGSEALGIKWSSGKGRALTFCPPRPTIDAAVNVTIELEFKILPDGSVADVVPIRKADAKLEEIAIRFLKNCRFSTVTDDDRNDYVGIVPIRFKVR